MKIQSWARLSAAVAAVGLLAACADSATSPVPSPLAIAPVAAHTNDPSTTDFRTFPGELWVCPDVPYPVVGFLYRWNIVDNATNTVVQSGVSTNITGGTCVKLASVPTSPSGHYTAWVREDPAANFKISSITADYGLNLPIPAPVATVDLSRKSISDLMTSDYGVVMVFYH